MPQTLVRGIHPYIPEQFSANLLNLLDGLEFYLMLPSSIMQCLLHVRL